MHLAQKKHRYLDENFVKKSMELMVNLNICRVCMKSKKGFILTHSADLRDKFVAATKLQYSENDNMPKEICSSCVPHLKVAYEFVQLAHASDNSLRGFLNKISNDFQKVTKLNTDTDKNTSETSTLDDNESQDAVPAETEQSSVQQPASKKRKVEKMLNDKKLGSPTLDKMSPKARSSSSSPIQEKQQEKRAESMMEIAEQPLDDEGTEEDEESYMVYSDLTFESDLKQVDKQEFITEIEDDDDSQVDLEILDEQTENSQPQQSLTSTNSRPIVQNDAFLKEYETMLIDSDEKAMEYGNDESGENSADEFQQYQNNEGSLHVNTGEMKIEVLDTTSIPLKAVQFDEDSRSSTVQQATLITTADASTSKPKPYIITRKQPTKRGAASRHPPSGQKSAKEKLGHLPRYFCSKCNRDFSTRTNLNRHVATHEGKRPYECEICGKGFTQNGSLKQHMYVHTGERPFVCEVCNRGFTQCKSLIFHMRRHTGEKPFPCGECGLCFRQKDGLKMHIMKHHTITATDSGDTETHICIICKEALIDKDAMDLHMKTHVNNHQAVTAGSDDNPDEIIMQLIDDDNLFEVKSAELQNSSNISATTHVVDVMATSASEPSRAKKYQCRKCFKCFALRKSLLRHLSIHDFIMALFKCTYCGATFSSDLEQKQHMQRIHKLNIRTNLYQCEDCEMIFPTADKLNEHMKENGDHVKEHEFSCSICSDVKFEYEKDLMEHMLEHEANEMVEQDDEDADVEAKEEDA